jgi:hypothetical protein
MKPLKILMVVTALVVIVGLTTDAWAQCPSGRVFRSAGKPGVNVRVDVSLTDPGDNEIGRLWDSDNANNSNGGLTGPNFGNLCPISEWWVPNAAGLYNIDGGLTVGGCAQVGCPSNAMTIVVEDYGLQGPPGVNDTAFYIGWKVDETPADSRWYDYSKVDGITAVTVLNMLEFPRPVITSTNRDGATIVVNYNLADQAANNHTWNNSAGAPFPIGDIVSEWQLVKATGDADPGRLRSNGWVTIQSSPYVPGGDSTAFNVPCADTATDEYIAVGIGFNGGASGTIDSALVGPAIQLECDPNLAQPDEPQNIQRKPTATQIGVGRSGGRR